MAELDAIFVANNPKAKYFRQDPSFIYRCENLGLALDTLGFKTQLTHLRYLTGDEAPQVAVFHRPQASNRLRAAIQSLKRKGTVLLADFDDLVFLPELAHVSPAVLNKRNPQWWIRRRFEAHRQAIPAFNGLLLSTTPLLELAQRHFPGSHSMLLPNCVHLTWRDGIDTQGTSPSHRRITYFPGTRSHDRDFATITRPLTRFLSRHRDIHLQITGKLHFDVDLPAAQIEFSERLPFADYAHTVRQGWVNLAPLESTPFNQAKSALKVIEAGFWGIPTLCTPNEDNARLNSAGAILTDTEDAWESNLERMTNRETYRSTTHGLQDKTLALADILIHAKDFAARWIHAR